MKSIYFSTALLLVSFVFHSCKPSKPGNTGWFPFIPTNTFEPGMIGMQDWLDAPSGKHGFLQMEKGNLQFEDGTPVKFWGTNICSQLPFVEAEKADSFANFMAKYGVNAVRFHKFTRHAYDGKHSTRLSPEKFNRFDYFQHQLREQGIYYGWSHIYGHKVLPGDSSKLLAYGEIKNLEYPWSHLNASTSSLVNFAPDLQDLSIALTVNMLEHVNPYTGLRYADDPALAFIEFQNEDNIFWGAIERSLQQAPTYKALLSRMFSKWLTDKYTSQESLEKAWGKQNIPQNELLSKQNISPQPSHHTFSLEYETALKENRPMARHILDKMRFLYETQMNFYRKFEKAIRETGYKGVLVASCWQAGSGISHFYNLHADYSIGMIDRHNYFGGGAGGHRLDTGAVKNNYMLSDPGSGLLGTGMQQVADRPFAFSEWMSLVPNQWTAEAAPIIAAYGMGLQGWDASFSFATDIPRFSRLLESESHGVYNATSPLHMGLYPALARMVYRGDLQESEILATRNVHIPSMENGTLGFEEKVDQGYDDKRFTGSVPPQTLAIGKIPVKFTDKPEKTIIPDLSEYMDSTGNVITSATSQLTWNYGTNGYITLHSEGTKGVIGFIPDEKINLGNWSLTTTNRFAAILFTSLERDKSINETNNILITMVARGKNTGMEYNETGDALLSKGTSPLLLEPVNLRLELPNAQNYEVEALNQDGLPTGNVVAANNEIIQINSGQHQSIWYLLKRSP